MKLEFMIPVWLFVLLVLGAFFLVTFSSLTDEKSSRPIEGKKIKLPRNRDLLNESL